MASLTSNPPAAPSPRHRSRKSASGIQAAVNNFAVSCYPGMRSTAHEHEIDSYEQTALDCLAALSVLARWIEKASVEIP